MNRRTFLKGAGGFAAGLLLTPSAIARAQGTPAAEAFPVLTITVTDDAFEIPARLVAGRYEAHVVNNGTTSSHSSLGRLPDGTNMDDVHAFSQTESEDLPDWFLKAGYVGLPDWPAPGQTVTGAVDLAAGDYFMFDPFSPRVAYTTVAAGALPATEPDFTALVELTEMRIIVPDGGLPLGPARLKISDIGAIAHEFQVLAVPAGTTTDQMLALMSLPQDATPVPGDALQEALFNYQPAAATSILGAGLTAWLDTDLAPGTYALACMLPFPGDVPHAMEGMMEIVTLG